MGIFYSILSHIYTFFQILAPVVAVVIPIITFIYMYKAYGRWKTERLIQMHINLKTQRYYYYDKNNDDNIEDDDKESYGTDYLNELEFIADLTLKNRLDKELMREHFKTWYKLIEDERWMEIINQARENNDKAYRKLLELAKLYGFKEYIKNEEDTSEKSE